MIIRLSIFLVLLASFYFYCQDGSSPSRLNSPNDMNMIEIPKDFEPEFRNDLFLEAWLHTDSSDLLNAQDRQLQRSQIELASSLQ